MNKTRMMKVSTFQAVADIFRAPLPKLDIQPSLLGPWNVYDEAMMRAKYFTPVFPYIYIVEENKVDLNLTPPVLTMALRFRSFGLDLGRSNYAKAVSILMHCIGRSKGESEDIASYLSEALRAITIYDYNNPFSPGTKPVLDTRTTTGGPSTLPARYWPVLQTLVMDSHVNQQSLAIPASQRFQGLLTSAELLSFSYITSF